MLDRQVLTALENIDYRAAEITEAERDELADRLFKIGAVKFGAFRIKLHETRPDAPLSPIYLNFRLLRSYPDTLAYTAGLLDKLARPLNYELLADIPTGVTPLVAVMALLSGKPMISPRKETKSYGLGVAIDGAFRAGQPVLLVDDVISGGDSKLDALQKLSAAGLQVRDLLVVVDRQQGGTAELANRGYRLHSVATISRLLDRYRQTGAISQEQYIRTVEYLGLN